MDKSQKVLKPLPYFYNYSANWNSDRRFKLMSLPERGVLWTLYNEYWVNNFLPRNPSELARYFGYDEKTIMDSLTPRVLSYFVVDGDQMRCPELDGYKSNVTLTRQAQSDGGKLGAAIKKVNAKYLNGVLDGKPQGIPEGSLSQINSNSIKSIQFISKEGITDEHKEWLKGFEEENAEQSEYLKQSKGG